MHRKSLKYNSDQNESSNILEITVKINLEHSGGHNHSQFYESHAPKQRDTHASLHNQFMPSLVFDRVKFEQTAGLSEESLC